MNGAKRVNNYFWLCERSKQVIAVELISREEIRKNMIFAAIAEWPCYIKIDHCSHKYNTPKNNTPTKKRKRIQWKKNRK